MIAFGEHTFHDEEEAESFFDEKLFEVKRDLLQKPLLRATVKQRLKTLDQLSELEALLELGENPSEIPQVPVFSSLSMDEQWKLFSRSISQWKLAVSSCDSAITLKQLVEFGFSLWLGYCTQLPELVWEEDVPKVGVAENIMVLQEGFDRLKNGGIVSYEQLLKTLEGNSAEKESLKLFLTELKRLSLRVPYL